MKPRPLGIFLLCVGASNVLVGVILAVQIAPDRIGASPYELALSGLVMAFGGYYTGKRKEWN